MTYAGQAPGSTPPEWSMWVLNHAQVGLLVIDQDCRLEFLNQWFKNHARLNQAEVIGRPLTDVFPSLLGSHFEKTLHNALRTGFAAVLSNGLHGSPFLLYKESAQESAPVLLQQSIHIMPMGDRNLPQTGPRRVLVQISDVTQAVSRERLLKAQASAMHGMARMDALTGIGNRRQFDETLESEFRQALRQSGVLSVILADIDSFKKFNDNYGHVKGDEALALVAQAMRSCCNRPRDLAARYGGEELVLILPDTNAQGALVVATELQAKLVDLAIEHAQNQPTQKITMSMGIATLVTPTPCRTATELFEQADQALYQAKQSGRNKICTYGVTPSAIA